MDITWWSDTVPTELVLLALAFVFSAIVGIERHRRLKDAGMRTHTLVGVGSAVFTLVSAYGFAGSAHSGDIHDPTRIAAQIVSGIGFLGAGVIFVRRGSVSGLTTAASIWVAAGIGMACGAGMPILAAGATALHLVTVTVLSRLGRFLQPPPNQQTFVMHYRAGQGSLPSALAMATQRGMTAVVTGATSEDDESGARRMRTTVQLQRTLAGSDELIDAIAAIPGVTKVQLVSEDDHD